MDQSTSSEHLRTRYAAIRVLVHAAELDEAAPSFLAVLGRAFGCELGVVWLVGEDDAVHASHVWSAADRVLPPLVSPAIPHGNELVGRAWARRESQWIDDLVDAGTGRVAELLAAGLRSVLAVPLVTPRGVLGVLELASVRAHGFAEGSTRVVEELAVDLAHFIERIRGQPAASERSLRLQLEARMRENEAKLNRLYDSDLIGIFVADLQGGIREANEAFLRMLGESRAELEAGEIRWDRLTPPDWRAQDVAAVWSLLRHGSVGAFSKEYYRKSGTRFPIILGAAMLEGSTTECICFVLDDSARRSAEDALSRLNEQLESRVHERTESLRASEQRAEQTAQALARSERQLRALAGRLQAVREEERTELAREIHDVLGQELTGLKMDVAWMSRRLATRHEHELVAAAVRLGSMRERIDETIGTVRRLASGLRPGVLDDLGLATAIEWQAHEFASRSGLPIDIDIDEIDQHVDRARATAVFRIFQELLTNVARHAAANHVQGRLAIEDRQIVLEVQDDGRGIAQHEVFGSRSLGLIGIRERVLAFGGEFTVVGLPGRGTRATVRIPVAGSAP